jgi:hypothetical protein
MDFPYIDCDSNFLYFKNEFILLAFLKLRKQDFEAKKWLYSLKPRNCLSAQTTRVLQLPAWNHAVKLTSISQKNILKKQ